MTASPGCQHQKPIFDLQWVFSGN